ncbi:MAG TPA: hypothetical protein VGK48_07185 [Terriglobia bacterium]|jgi:hypothetical protein
MEEPELVNRWLTRRAELDRGIRRATADIPPDQYVVNELQYIAGQLLKWDPALAATSQLESGNMTPDILRALIDTLVHDLETTAVLECSPLSRLPSLMEKLLPLGVDRQKVETDWLALRSPQFQPDNFEDITKSLKALPADFASISIMKIEGDPTPLDGCLPHSPHVNHSLLKKVAENLSKAIMILQNEELDDRAFFGSFKELFGRPISAIQPVAMSPNLVADGVNLVRERYIMQREALLNVLARDAQKPDHVIYCGCVDGKHQCVILPPCGIYGPGHWQTCEPGPTPSIKTPAELQQLMRSDKTAGQRTP